MNDADEIRDSDKEFRASFLGWKKNGLCETFAEYVLQNDIIAGYEKQHGLV